MISSCLPCLLVICMTVLLFIRRSIHHWWQECFFASHSDDIESLEEWLSHDDHLHITDFYGIPCPAPSVSSRSQLQKLASSTPKRCRLCHDTHVLELSREAEILSSHEPLTFMELFNFMELFAGKLYSLHIWYLLVY